MVELYYLFIFVVSFAVTTWINYYNNSVKIQKLILRWEGKCFHIHHWFTFGCLLGALILGRHLKRNHYNILLVILMGIIAEDFLFKDVFIFCRPCKELLKY